MKSCYILLVFFIIEHEMCLLLFKILKGLTPAYTKDMIGFCNVNARLRSTLDDFRVTTSVM